MLLVSVWQDVSMKSGLEGRNNIKKYATIRDCYFLSQ